MRRIIFFFLPTSPAYKWQSSCLRGWMWLIYLCCNVGRERPWTASGGKCLHVFSVCVCVCALYDKQMGLCQLGGGESERENTFKMSFVVLEWKISCSHYFVGSTHSLSVECVFCVHVVVCTQLSFCYSWFFFFWVIISNGKWQDLLTWSLLFLQ